MVARMTHGCTSITEVGDMFAMHNIFSLCPADSVDNARLNHPKSTIEAANLVQEYHRSHNRD